MAKAKKPAIRLKDTKYDSGDKDLKLLEKEIVTLLAPHFKDLDHIQIDIDGGEFVIELYNSDNDELENFNLTVASQVEQLENCCQAGNIGGFYVEAERVLNEIVVGRISRTTINQLKTLFAKYFVVNLIINGEYEQYVFVANTDDQSYVIEALADLKAKGYFINMLRWRGNSGSTLQTCLINSNIYAAAENNPIKPKAAKNLRPSRKQLVSA